MNVPKYRKHSSRDYAVVEFRGRRKSLPGRFGSDESKRAYQRFLRDEVMGPDVPLGKPRTVAGVLIAYLDFAKGYYPQTRRSEFENCKTAFKVHAQPWGNCLVADFGPLKLKELQQSLVAKCSRSYINGITNRIKRAFRWAVSEELIEGSVLHALESVDGLRMGRTKAREPAPIQPVAWEHVTPVVKHVSPTIGAMLILQLYTGARSGSICRASADQFTAEGELWHWRPRHKTEHLGHEVVIPIGRRVQEILAPFMQRTGLLFRPGDIRQDRRYRVAYDSASYAQALARGQKRAGVPKWTPHQLRHTLGTIVRDKYGIEAAQAMLGHASLDATQLYAGKRLSLAATVALEIG